MDPLSVYDRLILDVDIRMMVNSFHERVARDPRLAPFFEGIDVTRLKEHQAKFLTAALGGPRNYDGMSMHDAHSGLRIRKAEFEAVSDHLMNVLTDFNVDEDLVAEVVDILATLESEVVNSR